MPEDIRPTPSEIVFCNATAFADARHAHGVLVPGALVPVDRFQLERTLLLTTIAAHHAGETLALHHRQQEHLFGFLRRFSVTLALGAQPSAWPEHTLEARLHEVTREVLEGEQSCSLETMLRRLLVAVGGRRRLLDAIARGALERGVFVGVPLAAPRIAPALVQQVALEVAFAAHNAWLQLRHDEPHLALATRRIVETALRSPALARAARPSPPPARPEPDEPDEQTVDLDDWERLNRKPPSASED